MKVGDYVRTKEFGINKVKWFDHEEPILENGFTALQRSGYKSSPNIIDLIEVGDYVNGHRIIDIAKDQIRALYSEDINQKYALIPMINKDIKSIVTREQFEAMQYKVGE